MSVFVVNCETIEGTEVVGVYLNEKLAKAAAKEYVDTWYEDGMKKKQAKKDTRKVIYVEDTKENPAVITMTETPFDLPKGKGKKEKKDPLAPKKGLSPFMIFNKENREKIKISNPNATFGDIGKLIGTAWKALNEKQKAVYTQKAETDKERYVTESAAYTVVDTTVAAPTETAAPKKRAAKKAVAAE